MDMNGGLEEYFFMSERLRECECSAQKVEKLTWRKIRQKTDVVKWNEIIHGAVIINLWKAFVYEIVNNSTIISMTERFI